VLFRSLNERKDLTKNSQEVPLIFVPNVEFFNQKKPLVPCDISLKMSKNDPTFYIMGANDKEYVIQVTFAVLILKTIILEEDFDNKLSSLIIEKGKAIYPMLRTEINDFLLTKGVRSINIPMAKLGKQPIRIYLAFITNEALNGAYEKNPFNFNPNFIATLSFTLKNKTFPTIPLAFSWYKDSTGEYNGEGVFLRAFNELQRTTGVLGLNNGYGINRKTYPKGYFVIGQKLTEAFSDTLMSPHNEGTLSINLTFAENTKEILNCLIMLEYQNIITISTNGEVETDYTT
jgi:hypothetical protein